MAVQPGQNFDTPTIPASEAILTISCRTPINAPASLVFRTIRNTDTWKDWNRLVPKVIISHQPPEIDNATAAEINELVRNTSIIGSFYSDLTDGGIGIQKHGPDEQPPARFRLNSTASGMSQTSSNGVGESAPLDSVVNGERGGSTFDTRSAAQRFADAQSQPQSGRKAGSSSSSQGRKGSLIPPRDAQNPMNMSGRRPSTVSTTSTESAHARKLVQIYGEPSVRIQPQTKMTFFMRMEPASSYTHMQKTTEEKFICTDVSRPDDPITEAGTTALTRSHTHSLERSGIYRLSWSSDHEGASIFNVSGLFGSSSGGKTSKFALHSESVHEIIPSQDGAGNEICVYRCWTNYKGAGAKRFKKDHEAHLNMMYERMSEGLKGFVEGLYAPRVERRDFSVDLGRPLPVVAGQGIFG